MCVRVQVVKAVCRCTFKENSDEFLVQCVLCYVYSELLQVLPATRALTEHNMDEDPDTPALAGSESHDVEQLRHHLQNFSINPLGLSRAANWLHWGLEKVGPQTRTETLKLCDVSSFSSLNTQHNPDGVVCYVLPCPAQLPADAVSCACPTICVFCLIRLANCA